MASNTDQESTEKETKLTPDPPRTHFKIGSRKSKLAMVQSE